MNVLRVLLKDRNFVLCMYLAVSRQLLAVLTVDNIVLMDVWPAHKVQEGRCLGCTGGSQKCNDSCLESYIYETERLMSLHTLPREILNLSVSAKGSVGTIVLRLIPTYRS